MNPVIDPWWSQQAAGMIGGGIGMLGALFGTVIGIGMGRARTPAHFALLRAFMLLFAAIGLGSLFASVLALLQRQPYHVSYPLGLGGVIFASLSATFLYVLHRRARALDNRRLDAESIRRG